jgi:hypothetical protein
MLEHGVPWRQHHFVIFESLLETRCGGVTQPLQKFVNVEGADLQAAAAAAAGAAAAA